MTSGTPSNPEPTEPQYPRPHGGAVVVESGSSSASTAEAYVSTELQKARASLRLTQIVSVLILVIPSIIIYSLVSGFTKQLEPHAAAEIADGMLMSQVNDRAPEMTSQIKQKIPEFIAKIPDSALEELPKYRMQLADRVEADLNKYCQETSTQLGSALDTYLDTNKDQVKGLLTSGNDPAQVKQVGDGLKQTLMTYIREKPANGEAVGTQIDKALESLLDVQKRVHRLATATDLTPLEKKARHAIAVMTQGIDAHKELQLMH